MSPEIRARHTLAVVLRVVAGDALSAFEEQAIVEIAARRAAFGDQAVITDAEADILAIAVDGMKAQINREIASVKAEFAEACERALAAVGGAA